VNFSSDLAGFVDRPISEMLYWSLLDPSARVINISLRPFKVRKRSRIVVITQMHVKGLMFDPYNNAYIVVLRDEEHSDILPIWVGKSEAGAISMSLENVTPPRPMTHDFMKSLLDAYNAKVISVVITDLSEHTYFAKIHLMYEDSEYTVDARPSDAIALALRSNAPVFANDSVITKQSSEELEQWLENLKPEDFGKLDS
jgi:bifunctional DNase/RNase